MLAYYHLFEFTYFTTYTMQGNASLSFVVIMIIMTGVNLGIMIRKNILKYKNNKRLKKIQDKIRAKVVKKAKEAE